MNKTLVLLAAVIPLLGADCIGVRYEIALEPKEDGLQRTITAASAQEGPDGRRAIMPDKNELKRIAALYGQAAPTGDAVTGTFSYRTPADVGGAGFYARLSSPMGTAFGYVERIRGNDDLAGQIDRIRHGADKTVDLLAGWLRAELGRSPQCDRLCAFIKGPFRRDLENVALAFWAGKFSSDHEPPGHAEAAQKDLAARLAVYVLERGYIRADDVPTIVRAAQTDQPGTIFKLIQRLVATKMGIPADRAVPKSLAFLAGPKTAEASLKAYLAGTEQYKGLLKAHRQEQAEPDDTPDPPDPMEVLLEPLVDLAVPFWGFLTRADQVTLALATGVEPMHHNGTWVPQGGKVTWKTTIRTGDKAKGQLPAVFWAVWGKPNRALQTKHFGKVLLADERLVEYGLWYAGLTRAEAGRWDAFVADLTPGDDPETKARTALAGGREISAHHPMRAGLDLLQGREKNE